MTKGECIREMRTQAGLTQQELGDRLGVTSAMICSWESGKRNPNENTMRRIYGALGADYDRRVCDGLIDDLRQCVRDASVVLERLDAAYRIMHYLLTVIELRIGDGSNEAK